MFKFYLLIIFSFLLFAPKSYALIDYDVLDSVTDELTQVFDSSWTYNDTTDLFTFNTDRYNNGFGTYDFRLYACPDKDGTSYALSDCSVFDKVNVVANPSGSGTSLLFDNGEIDADNRSYLVILMEDSVSHSATPFNFSFYEERVIDTTVTPVRFYSLGANVAPVGTSFSRNINEGGSIVISFTGFSISRDASSTKIVTDENGYDFIFTGQTVTAPSHGTVEYLSHPIPDGGGVIYTHGGSNTPRTDTFIFKVTDWAEAISNEITATININSVADNVVFGNSPISLTEGQTVDYALIVSDDDNRINRVEYPSSLSGIGTLLNSVFKFENRKLVIDPTLDTEDDLIFSSTGGSDEAIVPYNASTDHPILRTTPFSVRAYDSSDVLIEEKDFVIEISSKNLPTSITSSSPIQFDPSTNVNFDIEFTNEDGDSIGSDKIFIVDKPSWLTVDKTRGVPTETTGTISFGGTTPTAFGNIDMTVRVLDPSESAGNDYVEKVFRIQSTETGTLDFDESETADESDAAFLYLYLLSKQTQSIDSLLNGFVKGGAGSDAQIQAAKTSVDGQLQPQGVIDFDISGAANESDAAFLYLYLLSKQTQSIDSLLNGFVKGGGGSDIQIQAAKDKVDSFLTS